MTRNETGNPYRRLDVQAVGTGRETGWDRTIVRWMILVNVNDPVPQQVLDAVHRAALNVATRTSSTDYETAQMLVEFHGCSLSNRRSCPLMGREGKRLARIRLDRAGHHHALLLGPCGARGDPLVIRGQHVGNGDCRQRSRAMHSRKCFHRRRRNSGPPCNKISVCGVI